MTASFFERVIRNGLRCGVVLAVLLSLVGGTGAGASAQIARAESAHEAAEVEEVSEEMRRERAPQRRLRTPHVASHAPIPQHPRAVPRTTLLDPGATAGPLLRGRDISIRYGSLLI